MATVDFYIWKRPKKDGKYAISVRITINRKASYIVTGQKLDSLDQWDEKRQCVKKTHPNSARLNNYLRAELAKANDKALEMETKGQASAKEVKFGLKPIEEQHTYFNEIADRYLEDHKLCGNYDAYKTDTGRLKRFYEMTNGGKITFPEITVELLQRYLVHLRAAKRFRYNANSPVKPLSERSITNHMILIRTIYNRAITAKKASKDDYPFGAKGKIAIKITGAGKMGLDETEIKKLEELDLSHHLPIYNDARNIWLTEFYFAGMRVTDCLLLKWPDFQNGRLYYQMSKNGEHGSVKVPAKALTIINQYRQGCNDRENNKHNLVFPLLQELPSLDDRYELRRKIGAVVKRLNKTMGAIMEMIGSTKSASQHKARHSFAQRAEEKEIHPKVLQKMYRHESVLTTMKYQSNFSFSKADEAIDAVLNF
ncbi:tyrosine-type recombinase/integrase [Mucilaginibacter sp. HD30]